MNLRSVVAAGARVHPPGWLCDNLCYETMMGSVAYGVSSDSSDMDVCGIKRHLLHCLEMHYGDLSSAVVQPDEAVRTLHKIAELTQKYR